MPLKRDKSGRLHIDSPLMGESLMDKAVLAQTDGGPLYRPMPDLIVVKIGGQSIIDRGRSALLPVLDELVKVRQSYPLIIATGAEREPGTYTASPPTWVCPPAFWPGWVPASASRTR